MSTLKVLVVAGLLILPLATGGQEAWPELSKGKLFFKKLGDKYGRTVKTEVIEITREGTRIAQVTKSDRDGDGKFEEFIFTASVARTRVFSMTRLGGTNESVQFFSHDDTMILTDLRVPETKVVALVIVSGKHHYYEIFTRHEEGYYWPANDDDRNSVDAFFRGSAEEMAPLLKKLAK